MVMDWGTIIYFVVIIGGMACFMVLPRRKQQKKMKEKMENLTLGQKVQTIGGIFGSIIRIQDNTLTLETGTANIVIAKNAVALVVPDTVIAE
jgi:preprotein translocase subunit YajC